MTPPRKTAELPGTSVIRWPRSPPVLDSATARVNPRSAMSRTTSAADGLCSPRLKPVNAAPDRLPDTRLGPPAQLPLRLGRVQDGVLGQGHGPKAGEAGPAGAPGPAPQGLA